ncbi:hypothetical protein CA267_002965 [Alteromonas pelagimontana]|uniref:Uncharacterized protein n=1 Tax=Alteromonas pelagimontana TaxID=1858656 RepID=A0A6M4MAI0_9ALTE|nr:hypothetical protein [Alteromonas pelagimontana]QJR79818.1 hypothetical protein CA267_002965 [Alteromonas pelagimontana]
MFSLFEKEQPFLHSVASFINLWMHSECAVIAMNCNDINRVGAAIKSGEAGFLDSSSYMARTHSTGRRNMALSSGVVYFIEINENFCSLPDDALLQRALLKERSGLLRVGAYLTVKKSLPTEGGS